MIASRRLRAVALALGGALALSGCGTTPPLRVMACPAPATDAPVITTSADGQTASTTLSVLTYNLEGLPWPARSNRSDSLAQIGQHIAALRANGQAPDVILFQEMFSNAAKRAVAASDYPAIASGPNRSHSPANSTRERLPGRSQILKGEVGFSVMGSGLAAASRYPIANVAMRSFGRRSCAGFDCLSNKGVMLTRIVIPGVPFPVDLFNTHMNARGASKVSAERNQAAHNRQSLEAAEFVDAHHDLSYPLIFGGDFNMRHSEERWAGFSPHHPMALVHEVCVDPASGCDVPMSWDGDAPWMDTQDLQFYGNGIQMSVRPIRAEAMFDGRPDSPKLSDHDGFLVTYELRWSTRSASRQYCTIAQH